MGFSLISVLGSVVSAGFTLSLRFDFSMMDPFLKISPAQLKLNFMDANLVASQADCRVLDMMITYLTNNFYVEIAVNAGSICTFPLIVVPHLLVPVTKVSCFFDINKF
jgi:hypothetical protein